MEQIKYRKTLDVHKNGTQFLLQGFGTADNLSRVVEISLMQSGDAIDFPLEKIIAIMYVFTPGTTEPNIYNCTIKDNKVVFKVPHIDVEGITTMQLKLIETSTDGARSVLASPKFACELIKSNIDDESIEQGEEFTRFEDAVAKAKSVYDERFLRMELSSDCIFRAFYADGTTYETDVLQKLFLNGNVLLSESFAHGGTGVRAGEDTDNSKYYSNVSKSESLNAKSIMENSEDILEEVRLHGVYTAFSLDFESGEVEYVSPSFSFKVNTDTGELDAEGQSYTFSEEIYRIVDEWLLNNNVKLNEIQALADRITPIDKGGTAADNIEDARTNLDVFSKAEVCNPTTFELFGHHSESKPDDILKIFGEHWWRKISLYKYPSTEGASTQSAYLYLGDSETEYTVYSSTSISWTQDAETGEYTYTLDNPSARKISYYDYYGLAHALRGRYVSASSTLSGLGSYSSTTSKEIFYISESADSSYDENGTTDKHNCYVYVRGKLVSLANGRGDWTLVSSPNADAYTEGIDGEFEYEYLGVPFQNAIYGAKAEEMLNAIVGGMSNE
jgi:hypothetical protein